ncbi:hypothetical protein HY312_00920 [Candidatus Saccharibacteria bacterium]|nr:hypothetical protein [Candidatus Saccharibacteria bacterium]
MQFAYEVLAQIGRASESLDEPEWYEIMTEILMALDVKTVSMQLIQTWFYIRMSAMLGDELNTQRDFNGDKLLSDKMYRYDSNEKGLVEAVNGEINSEHIKILRLVAAKPLSVLLQVGGMGDYLAECLYVSRQHAAL